MFHIKYKKDAENNQYSESFVVVILLFIFVSW